MTSWTLTLEGFMPLSMNEREGYLMRKMVFIIKRQKQLALEALTPEIERSGITPATGRRRVEFTFRKGYRTRKRDDPSNRSARTKALLDVMVQLGLLIDDDDTWLDYARPEETKGDVASKQGPAVIIRVIEVAA